jgi:hypothetical protein
LLSVVLIGLLFVNVTGCATFGSAKGKVAGPYFVAHAVLKAVSDAEPRLVCGRPTAAPAPACIPIDLHHTINARIEQAGRIDLDANAIIKDLPEGAAEPAKLLALLPDLWNLINEILADIPPGPTKTQLTKLAEVK